MRKNRMKQIELSRKLKKEISSLFLETNELEEILSDLEIDDQDDYTAVVNLIQEYKTKKEYLDSERTSINKPINEIRTKVNKWFMPTIHSLDKCIIILREKIVEYELNIIQKKRKALKKGKKLPKQAKSEDVSFRESWDFQIENFDDIPREYLTLDRSKVKIELRELKHKLKIPGLKIFKSKIPIIS